MEVPSLVKIGQKYHFSHFLRLIVQLLILQGGLQSPLCQQDFAGVALFSFHTLLELLNLFLSLSIRMELQQKATLK